METTALKKRRGSWTMEEELAVTVGCRLATTGGFPASADTMIVLGKVDHATVEAVLGHSEFDLEERQS